MKRTNPYRAGVTGLAVVGVLAAAAGAFGQDAPGPHAPLTGEAPAGFTSDDRIVATYYFYWYNVATTEHIVDPDGSDALQHHQPSMDGLRYDDSAWHRRQFDDMRAAGIDVAMPVFWGVPGRYDDWNFKGLRAMAEALDAMEAPPKIALFYDTTTLSGVDLTTDAGRDQFVNTVRDFFSMIPAKHWAFLDGRPIVWLYSSSFPKKRAPIERERLKAALGLDPFVVGDGGWKGIDAEYSWGAANGGPRIFPKIACVGPGYDDRAVPGRTTPVRDRAGGAFYEHAWRMALKAKRPIVAVETWNELHEGTEVCETKEDGRAYIDATRRYVDLFKKGETLSAAAGPYSGAAEISLDKGLRVVESEDGLFVREPDAAEIATKANRFGDMRYLYFDVDDSWWLYESGRAVLTVEYLDEGEGTIGVDYDAGGDAYRHARLATLCGTGAWTTATVELKSASFGNAQNAGADLRLAVEGRDLKVKNVSLVKR